MLDIVKRILSLMLLVVFLLPSTGLMMYVHKCNMSNSILVDVEARKPCCSPADTRKNIEHDLSCNISNEAKYLQQPAFSALPCCDDSHIYVKLGVHLLAHSIKALNADFPLFINNVSHQFNFTIFDPGIRIAANLYNYPPGEQPFLMFSNLRL